MDCLAPHPGGSSNTPNPFMLQIQSLLQSYEPVVFERLYITYSVLVPHSENLSKQNPASQRINYALKSALLSNMRYTNGETLPISRKVLLMKKFSSEYFFGENQLSSC